MAKEIENTKWHDRFMELAYHVAGWSKDRNTQVGCVIARGDTEITMGYNGFPRGANDDIGERYERPLKYTWSEHAERNAIYKAVNLGVSLEGCTIYSTYFPCADCVRAIIQSGITTLITPKPDFDHHKWGESWTIGLEMLEECGVQVNYYEYEPTRGTKEDKTNCACGVCQRESDGDENGNS